MLFGMKKKKTKAQIDTYNKYLPWGDDAKYEGTLNFIYDTREYQIYRVFSEENPILELRNVNDDNRLIKNPEAYLNRILNNLSIDSFDNTISIGQLKAAQDKSIVDELHKFIANLNTSGEFIILSKTTLSLKLNTKSSVSFI